MTNGENYAIQILVAQELGMKTGFVQESKEYLERESIQPILIKHFASQAWNCVQWINKMGLVDNALKVAIKYTNHKS